MNNPKSTLYDAIVVGLGGMGCSALYHLAKRGFRVLGIERFGIANEMGSSHGSTRMLRVAYHEHPSYVPLINQALTLWRDLEAVSTRRLFFPIGSIDAGPSGDEIFVGSRQSCEEHGLPYEVLTGREVNLRFPGYRLPEDHEAVLQPDGGVLLSDACNAAHLEAALHHGAHLNVEERVLSWHPESEGVVVETVKGRYFASKLVVSAGAWTGKLIPSLDCLLEPERQVVAWLQPLKPQLFQPDTFPIFNVAVEEGRYYGLSEALGLGFKIGRYHHLGQRGDADSIDRNTYPQDKELLQSFVSRYFPMAAGRLLSAKVCLFTLSPDEHFILDVLPGVPQVIVVAGFSGHGYKFTSLVGEVAADLAENGSTSHTIDLFTLNRFPNIR